MSWPLTGIFTDDPDFIILHVLRRKYTQSIFTKTKTLNRKRREERGGREGRGSGGRGRRKERRGGEKKRRSKGKEEGEKEVPLVTFGDR